jgi:TIR domain
MRFENTFLIHFMKNIRICLAASMFIIAGINCVQAKGFQPRIFIPEPEFYMDDSYSSPDTVPTKTFIKAQIIQPVQLKETPQLQPVKVVQIKPELTTKPAQNTTAVLTTPVRKDTALIRLLYEGFKPKTKTSAADKIKIRHIIDSVVSKKDNPPTSTGSEELSYQDLVRIIDSLLKANKIDSTKVIVDTAIVKKADSAVVNIKEIDEKKSPGSFIENYWWVIALAALVLAGLAFFIMKRKKGIAADPKIFFSYAWDQDEALIMQLYNSLKKDGFNVIKDKENIGYKGVISKFMSEIGSADFIIVAISDKYLKSKFCMYELYEIFRNSGMNSDKFGKKIFPIRIDESINLSDPDVVNGYTRYWKQQEQEWTTRVKEESDSITEEQARQFQFIKRLVNDVNNILSCLADINALDLSTLKSNDFADVKSALRKSM